MNSWLLEPVYWNWWILGVILMVVEAIAPGAFFLWMGIAALSVGLILTLFSQLDWTIQWLLFAVLSVASIVGWKRWQRSHPAHTDEPLLNRRGHQYVGRVFTLEAPVVNGQGKVWVDDTTWKVLAEQDCPAGAQLRITGVDGTVLKGEMCRDGN